MAVVVVAGELGVLGSVSGLPCPVLPTNTPSPSEGRGQVPRVGMVDGSGARPRGGALSSKEHCLLPGAELAIFVPKVAAEGAGAGQGRVRGRATWPCEAGKEK